MLDILFLEISDIMSVPTGRTSGKIIILCGRLYLMDEKKGCRTVTEF